MILIKLASRSRPNKFVKTLQNIRQMTTMEYKIIVSADVDDRTMNCPQMIKYVAQHPRAKMYFGSHCCKIEAINRDMDKAGDWDILVNMSDDFQIVMRSWDKLLRQQVAERWPGSTDWFAHFSDGYVHDALPTISIMGHDYYKRDGYIYHPSYKSFSCDAEAYFVALAREKHHYFEGRLFKHEHPANNRKLRNDSLYKMNANYSSDDVRNYFERLNNDFYLDIPGPFPWEKYKTNAATTSTSDSVNA